MALLVGANYMTVRATSSSGNRVDYLATISRDGDADYRALGALASRTSAHKSHPSCGFCERDSA